ncbi:hypothetical protein ACFL05_00740 [Patescibacteria group bacterium]
MYKRSNAYFKLIEDEKRLVDLLYTENVSISAHEFFRFVYPKIVEMKKMEDFMTTRTRFFKMLSERNHEEMRGIISTVADEYFLLRYEFVGFLDDLVSQYKLFQKCNFKSYKFSQYRTMWNYLGNMKSNIKKRRGDFKKFLISYEDKEKSKEDEIAEAVDIATEGIKDKKPTKEDGNKE